MENDESINVSQTPKLKKSRQNYILNSHFLYYILSDNDRKKNYTEDENIQHSINYTKYLFQKSFKRYDIMFDKFEERNKRCLESTCKNILNWIESNSKRIDTNNTPKTKDNPADKNFKPYREIVFNSIEVGKEGVKKIKEYQDCKRSCDENLIMFQNKFFTYVSLWEIGINSCFDSCRVPQKFHETNNKPKCILSCFLHSYVMLALLEFRIDHFHELILQEYDKPPRVKNIDLYHLYKERKFDEETINRYL